MVPLSVQESPHHEPVVWFGAIFNCPPLDTDQGNGGHLTTRSWLSVIDLDSREERDADQRQRCESDGRLVGSVVWSDGRHKQVRYIICWGDFERGLVSDIIIHHHPSVRWPNEIKSVWCLAWYCTNTGMLMSSREDDSVQKVARPILMVWFLVVNISGEDASFYYQDSPPQRTLESNIPSIRVVYRS